ncbi:MAG: hypothetical protein H7Z17_07070 [Fuerstia sp.]|nr:hypothetical protein [Fuerstiella sp.]
MTVVVYCGSRCYRMVGEIKPELPDREDPDDVFAFLLLTPFVFVGSSLTVREELTGCVGVEGPKSINGFASSVFGSAFPYPGGAQEPPFC